MTRVPERWDVGQWDTAHWDGQLGFDATAGAITLTGSDAGLIYTPAAAVDQVLTAAPGAIVVTGTSADLHLTRVPFVMPPPGRLEFGQRVFIPGRW